MGKYSHLSPGLSDSYAIWERIKEKVRDELANINEEVLNNKGQITEAEGKEAPGINLKMTLGNCYLTKAWIYVGVGFDQKVTIRVGQNNCGLSERDWVSNEEDSEEFSKDLLSAAYVFAEHVRSDGKRG